MSKAAWKDLFVDDDRDRVIGQIVRGGIVQAVIVGSPRKIRRAFALDGYPVVTAVAVSHQQHPYGCTEAVSAISSDKEKSDVLD